MTLKEAQILAKFKDLTITGLTVEPGICSFCDTNTDYFYCDNRGDYSICLSCLKYGGKINN